MSLVQLPPAERSLSRVAAIVGVGETDYGADYKAAREKREGYAPPTPETLAKLAFERALADSGLEREAIDGLSVSFLYGGPEPAEMAQILGIQPRYQVEAFGLMAGPLPQAVAAIAAGKADTIALVYAVATRSVGRKFGGVNFDDDSGAPQSYSYFHPWGWSSQAAHWALAWQHYRHQYNRGADELGAIAMAMRQHAQAHPLAVMQAPMSPETYAAARWIVKPLRLFDMCLVNDGGVCIILRRADLARGMEHDPVAVAGWGEAVVTADSLDMLVRQRLGPQFRAAGDMALGMAGLELGQVGHFEAYDASTMHLLSHVEGHGFVAPGTGLELICDGGIGPTGQLPINLGGGMLSGSYMHGWSHLAEIVRQLRREAGDRQVPDLEVSMFSLAQTNMVHPLVLTRGI